MMDRSDIIAQLKALQPLLRAEGVVHLDLFGSRARGNHRTDSDIDLLVEVADDDRFSLLDLICVEHIVADAFGVTANAVMKRSLDRRFREDVAHETIPIF